MCGFLKPPKIPAPPPPVAPPPPKPPVQPRTPTAPTSPEDAGLDGRKLGHGKNKRIGAGGTARQTPDPFKISSY